MSAAAGQAEAPALPDGWVMQNDQEGRTYYESVELGVTQWDFPDETKTTTMPFGWEKQKAPDGRVYFENAWLVVTQWNCPQRIAAPPVEGDEPLADGWVVYSTDDGRVYYESEALKLTQWARPDNSLPAGWVCLKSPDGEDYYEHVPSSRTQWEHPASVSAEDAVAVDGIEGVAKAAAKAAPPSARSLKDLVAVTAKAARLSEAADEAQIPPGAEVSEIEDSSSEVLSGADDRGPAASDCANETPGDTCNPLPDAGAAAESQHATSPSSADKPPPSDADGGIADAPSKDSHGYPAGASLLEGTSSGANPSGAGSVQEGDSGARAPEASQPSGAPTATTVAAAPQAGLEAETTCDTALAAGGPGTEPTMSQAVCQAAAEAAQSATSSGKAAREDAPPSPSIGAGVTDSDDVAPSGEPQAAASAVVAAAASGSPAPGDATGLMPDDPASGQFALPVPSPPPAPPGHANTAASAPADDEDKAPTWLRFKPRPTPEDAEPPKGPAEMADQLAYFYEIDAGNTGFVDRDDMRRFSELNDLGFSDDDIAKAVEMQDFDSDGKVTLRDFLLAQGDPAPLNQVWFHHMMYDRYVEAPARGATLGDMLKVCFTLDCDVDEAELSAWVSSLPGGRASRTAFRSLFLRAAAGLESSRAGEGCERRLS